VIPLYGFLEGDTIGLLVLAGAGDRIADLAARLCEAASLRVAPPERPQVCWRGRVLDLDDTVAAVGLEALDRIDVRAERGAA
jgi:hypothetical protein